MNSLLITDPIFRQTALTVLGIVFFSGIIVYFFRQRSYYFISAWANIKSWLVAAPFLFILFSFGNLCTQIILVLIAMYGAKIFFQLMGMYHRNYFVIICYLGIIGLGFCAYLDLIALYNQLPMICLGVCCFVPLIRNNYKRMIQYICLTLLAFVFLGWSFMHLGLILNLHNGIYQILYLIVLTEFCDNTNIAISRYFKGYKLFSRIDSRRNLWSTLISMGLTLALAGGMRWLLPDQSDKYWYIAGLIASLGGLFGELVMSVVRRDAGVKIVGTFILGRGDSLQRMDRLIFVAPIYYYIMTALQ
ncbi:MAG: phosphatidate cytidylyltransferase [Bdellovibrionota bacterium]